MNARGRPKILSERRGKWILNLYPPLLFGRIRTLEIGKGFRTCRVRVNRSVLTRNLTGTTFGGTIFSAADPFYALMYWQIMARRGENIFVTLKRAAISYLKPARNRLTLEFSLSDEDVERAWDALQSKGRYTVTYRTEAVDDDGEVCAVIDTEVYLRKGAHPGSGSIPVRT